MKYIPGIMLLILCGTGYGQSDSTLLNEVIISATKFYSKQQQSAQKIDVLGEKYISRVNGQNTGDLLISTGNLFVQKSQQGGSSPVIRGFEASRILLVVDGIRMNNAIYRAGHLQNVITLDQNMLERVEVIYGPSSTLYGSDALGGTLHFISKKPKLATGGETFTPSGNAFFRYSSVNNEKTAHADLNFGYQQLGWLSSVTFSEFGDVKMGSHYPGKYPDFGRRTQYVTNLYHSFIDSVVSNEDDRSQKFSGYKQWDIMQKLLFRPNDKMSHELNFQLSNSTNIPRYDRLQDTRNGTLRYAEWYYGPQERQLYAYTFSWQRPLRIIDNVNITASYQHIRESRQTRDYRRYDRFDSRREHVKVWGMVADAKKDWGRNELTVGADAQWNDLRSVADRTNLQTGTVSALDSRYPNGDNTLNYFGLYAQHRFHSANKRWVLNEGIRMQATRLHSTTADNSFFNLPVTTIRQNTTSVTGNIGLVVLPRENSRISMNLSSGCRAPNIDDLARVFESSSALQRVVIPNPSIRSEYTYSADLGLVHSIQRAIKMEANIFYTIFRNAISPAPFLLNGQDSILYNGARCQVVANQNINRANVYGFSAAVTATITPELSVYSTINYTRGKFLTDEKSLTSVYQKQPDGTYALVQANVSTKPMDHIPPLFGKTSVLYKRKSWDAEFFLYFNAWKRLDDYNPDGEDNAQYATADGIPSWMTFNFRSSVRITANLTVQAIVENIFDRNYRYFASGFSAPGRNFVAAVRSSF